MQKSQKWSRKGVLSLAFAGMLSMGLALAPSPVLAEELGDEAVTVADDQQAVEAVVEQGAEIEVTTNNETETAAVIEETTETVEATENGTAAEVEAEAEVEEAAETAEEKAVEDDLSATAGEKGKAPIDGVTGIVVDEGTYTFQSVLAPANVLDAAGKNPTSGSNISTWTYNGGENQWWIVERATEYTDPWYRLYLSKDSTLALSVAKDGSAGDNVLVKKATNDDSQLWAFTDAGSGAVKLVNALLGKALDIAGRSTKAGANVLAYNNKTSNDENQQFLMVAKPNVGKSDKTTEYEGAWTLAVKGTDQVLDLNGPNTNNGTNVSLWTSKNAKNQQFYLEPDGNGYYVAWVVATGKVLDVAKGSPLNGANVSQWTRNGGDNQLWSVKTVGGELVLTNKASGLMLGALDIVKGTNVVGVSASVASVSSFKATKHELLTAGIKEIHPRTASSINVDVASASAVDGGVLVLWTDTNALNQRFELVDAGDGLWKIRTASSGGWLTAGAKGDQLTQEGSSATKDSADVWRETFSGGWYGLINVNTGLAMDMITGSTAKGTKVGTWTPNGKDSQHYNFVDADLIKEGRFYLKNGNGRYMDVASAGTAADSNVLTWTKNGKDNQKFTITKSGNGYTIKNVNSGRLIGAVSTGMIAESDDMDISSSSFQYHNVEQQGSTVWLAQIGDGGYVEFVNKSTGENLVSRDSAADYNVITRKITFGSSTASTGRKWKLEAVGGWIKVNGVMHYFNSAGTQITIDKYGYQAYTKIKNMSSGSKYLIAVDKVNCRTTVFQGSKGDWEPIYEWLCATGSPEQNPDNDGTLAGTFSLGTGDAGCVSNTNGKQWYTYSGRKEYMKTRFQGDDGNWYAGWGVNYVTFIKLDMAFHSTVYGVSASAQLGRRVSHGCIRLAEANAKWIYYNVPNGTTVHIYYP